MSWSIYRTSSATMTTLWRHKRACIPAHDSGHCVLWTLFKCLVKCHFWVNTRAHTWHGNFLTSPTPCVIDWWRRMLRFSVNLLPQNSHSCVPSPGLARTACVAACTCAVTWWPCSADWSLNVTWHRWHSKPLTENNWNKQNVVIEWIQILAYMHIIKPSTVIITFS